jgi:hypothetical protein
MLRAAGHAINRNRVQRQMGIAALGKTPKAAADRDPTED